MPAYSTSVKSGIFVAASLSLVACAPVPSRPAPPAPVSATTLATTPAITPEAQKVLALAEKDVRLAREQFALWTTAESALKLAWEAAHAGDSARVTRHALRASEQVRAGLAQLAYPGTELK